MWTDFIDRAFQLQSLVLERRERVARPHKTLSTAKQWYKADGTLLVAGSELLYIEASHPNDSAHTAEDLIKLAELMKYGLIDLIIRRVITDVTKCRVYGIRTCGTNSFCLH